MPLGQTRTASASFTTSTAGRPPAPRRSAHPKSWAWRQASHCPSPSPSPWPHRQSRHSPLVAAVARLRLLHLPLLRRASPRSQGTSAPRRGQPPGTHTTVTRGAGPSMRLDRPEPWSTSRSVGWLVAAVACTTPFGPPTALTFDATQRWVHRLGPLCPRITPRPTSASPSPMTTAADQCPLARLAATV
jgi:hypothetical protein